MGVVNVAWRKAMAVVGRNFTEDEKNSGWPETFKHSQLAALQYPYSDTITKRLARARATDFLSACQSGTLPSSAITVMVTPMAQPMPRPRRFDSSEWIPTHEWFVRDGFISVRPSQSTRSPHEVTTYAVTAPAFATWLAAQREAPSLHIAAWFDALAGEQKSAQRAVDLESEKPTNQHQLVALGNMNAGSEWTGEKLAAQQNLFKAQGHRDFAKRTWGLAGIQERDGRRLVKEYQDSLTNPTQTATVFQMAKAVPKKSGRRR